MYYKELSRLLQDFNAELIFLNLSVLQKGVNIIVTKKLFFALCNNVKEIPWL
jgi:hypothetical protein